MHAAHNSAAHASAALWGAGRIDKAEARAGSLEKPEMLDKLCLVARELEHSYAACGAGGRIGSPCLVRLGGLLHDVQCVEGSGDAARTPRGKI